MEQSNDIILKLGQLIGKVDAILSALQNHTTDIETMRGRVDKLEQRTAYLFGISALSGATAALATKMFF